MEHRQIPLKVVYDEIVAPPGTTRISFGGGTGYLPNGNVFQISSGTITVTFNAASGNAVSATPVQELARRLDELTRKGLAAQDAIASALRTGVLGPAVPAEEDKAG